MRSVLWLCAFVLCAGAANANLRAGDRDRLGVERTVDAHVAGGVWLQERPTPGSVMPMPDYSRPLFGPHGGVVANLRDARPAS